MYIHTYIYIYIYIYLQQHYLFVNIWSTLAVNIIVNVYVAYSFLILWQSQFHSKVLLANNWHKIYSNGFSIIVPWREGLGCFARLTWWLETCALVEKIKHLLKSPLPYNFCHCAVDRNFHVFKTVISKL